ncbi:MAG TPA: MFS transporter [Acidobacteriaceae bacterium]|nr:MFS transporter [Acidobacteriaceae bacterium]
MTTIASAADQESSLRYAGWGVLAAAFAGVMVSFAPIIPYTFSLFLDPLHAAFGWKREAMGGAFALAAITVAFVSPLIGILLDRFPPRRIILPGILVFVVGLAALSKLTPNIVQFYATFFVLGLAANATAQFAYTRTILTWFTTHRGMALGLLLTGSGVGSILIPPLTQWMIQRHGWRSGFLLLAGIATLGLPLTAWLVRNRPEAAIVRAEHHADNGMTVAGALRTAAFWILACITILSAFSENGLVTNLAPILTQHGVLAATAALALSVRGGAGILGRLGVGFAIDRFSPERIQSLVLALAAAGTLILAFAGNAWTALAGAAVLGVGLGSESDVGPYLMARYFGRKHFSVLYGLTWTAYAIGGGTGPLWMGHLYDRAGAYLPRFIVYLAAVAFGAVILSFFLPANRKTAPLEQEIMAKTSIPLEG